jgi:hypothetical protein
VIGFVRRWWASRGGIPADLRAELEAEGLVLLEERLPASIIYRHYQVPGQRPTSGHQSAITSIALTRRRLVVRGTSGVTLDADPRKVRAEVEESGALLLAYEAADLSPIREGTVEMRFDTPRAAEIRARLEEWTARPPS